MSQNDCPQCGATGMVQGLIESTGVIRFRPVQTRFFTFRTGDIAVRATMCPSCGHIAMTGDCEKLRVLSGAQARPAEQPAPLLD
jgi:ribosomal protein S27AE